MLATLATVFKRYQREVRSDELFTEINYVLDQFAQPLLQLYQAIDGMISSSSDAGGREQLLLLLSCQVKLNKIFYSLSSQDLPAFFEDHLGEFMGLFKRQYVYKNALVEAKVLMTKSNIQQSYPPCRTLKRLVRRKRLLLRWPRLSPCTPSDTRKNSEEAVMVAIYWRISLN